jgi:predicted aspartyl protease
MRTRVSLFRYPVSVLDADGDGMASQSCWVDTGALYSQFPASLLHDLGYQPNAMRTFRLADGSTVDAPIGPVLLRIRDEAQPVICVFAEEGSDALLGATTLEAFSLAADPVNETLTPIVAMRLTRIPPLDTNEST